MADLKFEGDLDGVSEVQQNFIRCVLEERGYKNGKVVFETVGKAGDNYGANMKRIIVEKDSKIFKMIAKIAPTVEMVHKEISTASRLFRNEQYMYTHVLPKVTEMLKAAGVPKDQRFRYAICYGSFIETSNEVILLEDLNVSNFEMLDRFKPLPNDTVKLVLKNIATLHSVSFALKTQEIETYEEFDRNLDNMWLIVHAAEEMKASFENFEEDFLTILKNEKYKKLLRGSLSQIGDNIKKNAYIDTKLQSQFSVIQQGDPWTNNIMFRLEGDQALECCMIDYQTSKSGTPVGDIHYMIFNCTDYETRSKHFHEWMDYYHSELDKNLANFGLKASCVYSRDQLDVDMKRYAKLSFCIAIFFSSTVIRETADAAKDMDAIMQKKVSDLNEQSIFKFKNRIEGIMDSFLELGFFDN